MSELNVQVAQRFIEAHAAGDVGALLKTLHPDVKLHMDRTVLSGPEAVGEWAARSAGTLQFQLQPERFFDHGELVVAYIRMQFRWTRNGDLADDRPAAALFNIRDGLVLRVRSYDDRDQLDDETRERRHTKPAASSGGLGPGSEPSGLT